jgi:hypothetical protein
MLVDFIYIFDIYHFIFFSLVYIEFATPEKNLTTVEILFTTKARVGWVAHTAYITGWPILVILITMVICSLPFVRRGGHFQV